MQESMQCIFSSKTNMETTVSFAQVNIRNIGNPVYCSPWSRLCDIYPEIL